MRKCCAHMPVSSWAGFAVFAVPCEPQLVQGKTLDQEPFKAVNICE